MTDYGLGRTLEHQAEHGRKVSALLAVAAHPTEKPHPYAMHRDAPPVPQADPEEDGPDDDEFPLPEVQAQAAPIITHPVPVELKEDEQHGS